NPVAVTGAEPEPSAITSAPPSGFGLIGIEERVRIAGGDFSYGPTPDGRFVAQASIPWPA
ncbi:MAG TPA: two-component sensor histidine kinase, partial [Beutenbergiaceae bacterium]|nr:two-component sensor histidine kinase [Beutenbergiaceae bacterium]